MPLIFSNLFELWQTFFCSTPTLLIFYSHPFVLFTGSNLHTLKTNLSTEIKKKRIQARKSIGKPGQKTVLESSSLLTSRDILQSSSLYDDSGISQDIIPSSLIACDKKYLSPAANCSKSDKNLKRMYLSSKDEQSPKSRETALVRVKTKPLEFLSDGKVKKTDKPLKMSAHRDLSPPVKRSKVDNFSMKSVSNPSSSCFEKKSVQNLLIDTSYVEDENAFVTIEQKQSFLKPKAKVNYSPGHTKKSIKKRCKMCDSCKRKDCGKCRNCLDKVKFGGAGIKKQACIMRKCLKVRFA